MQEVWINNQHDLKEFKSYVSEEKLVPRLFQRLDDESIYTVGEFKVHIPTQFKIEDEKPKQEYDKLIFGKNPAEEIVNITIDEEAAWIYFKNGDVSHQPYKKWAIGSVYDEGCQKLKGHQFYKYIKDLEHEQYETLQESWNYRLWIPRSPEEGFMLRHGYTYYKGMKVSDVSLLSFDIEATSLASDAEDAYIPLLSTTYRDREGNIEKKLFDIFDYGDFESVTSDALMWQDINKYVQSKDPDIILGHNIFSYDLPYADINSFGGLNWGRDGSRIKFNKKMSKYRKNQQQQYDYFDVNIHGREVIDTFFLCMKYDISNDFPSYGLKAVEKHLGLVKEDRTWDFKTWPVKKLIEERQAGTELGFQKWREFREYCADDSDSPIKIFDITIPAFFYLTQSVPKTLQQVINQASGSQLDSLMIRSYLQDGYSLPKTSQKEPFEGAISMGIPGLYKNVRKVDVASLYPSIMLEYKIYDKKKDPNNHMLKMLEYFRNQRLENKNLAKTTGEQYYDDLQAAQKILINSLYGFLGAGYLLFNYPEGAAKVTKYGREILLKGVEWATGHTLKKVLKKVVNEGEEDEKEKYEWILGDKVSDGLGYTLVNVDTDSFSYTNSIRPSKEEYEAEIAELNSLYPDLIRWEKDGKTGIMQELLVIKAKNYVIVEDGKVKYKGSSITDQKKEPILLDFIHEFIDIILKTKNVNHSDTVKCYQKYCKEALHISNINKWTTKKTVTKSILNVYNSTNPRANESKPYDAIQEAIKHGVIDGIQEGDKIYLYSAIDGEIQKVIKGEPQYKKFTKKEIKDQGLTVQPLLEDCTHKENSFCINCNPQLFYPKMVENKIVRFPQLWKNDHDKKHYISRIYKTVEIFKKLIDIEKFIDYSSKKNYKLLESL